MCGIAGIITHKKRDFTREVERMTKVLSHRGPDSEGYFIDKDLGIYLGNRRLSVIDLSSAGNQPILNEDGSKVLVANCEIYNYRELRKKLQEKGHVFHSRTDSEVIIHAYEEFGDDFISYLDGMFAFAIWDRDKEELILARDRIGIKPLYYINKGDFFSFASEVKAFFEFDNSVWDKQIDENKLENLVFFPYIPDNENTIFKDIKKVSPGTLVIYKNDFVAVKKYWTLEQREYGISDFSQALERCEELLKFSVNKRLQTDVPIGILLSGGLDSSLIYSLAKQFPRQVHIFTARYEHKLDESRFARLVSGDCGESYHEITIDINKKIVNDIEKIIPFFDDLSTLDGGFFMTYLIAEQVKKCGVKVLLVGDGADELFGGYSWYGLSQLPFNFLPLCFKASIYYYALSRTFSSRRCLSYTNDIYRKLKSATGDTFKRISKFELVFQLPNHFLNRVDKATMAHGIEARVPYLDVDLVNFVYSLPRKFKFKSDVFNFNAANEKYILREIARKYLPLDIVQRKKYGFSIPMTAILKLNKDKVKEYLLENNSIATRYFKKGRLLKMLDFEERMYHPIEKEKEFLLWRLFLISVYMRIMTKG